MKKIITDSFNILKNNLIFILPFLMYLMFVMMFLPYILNNNTQIYIKIILAISVFLLTSANIAGWFHINKSAVLDYNPSDDKETVTIKTIKNYKLYFSGVGENFTNILFGLIFFSFIYIVLLYGIKKLCIICFGEPVIFLRFKELASITTVSDVNNFLNSFSTRDINTFTMWFITIFLSGIILNFLAILYLTEIIFGKNNFIKSFFTMLGFFFRNIFGCISILIFLTIIHFVLNILIMPFGANSIAITIIIMLMALYLNYYILLVMCFYNEKRKNNSNSRTEFIG